MGRWIAPMLAGLVAGLALQLVSPAACATALHGVPPIVHHAADSEIDPQNFAIAEGSEGSVFLGNARGVLEFDGEDWHRIALDNGEMVRSLARAPSGRIYVGGYDSFGWLERLATGEHRYRPLSDRFSPTLGRRDFADIWQIATADDGVYFRAVHDVFFVDEKHATVRHWHHEGRFGALFALDGVTYLQFRGEGLRRRSGDGWEPVAGTDAARALLYEALPLADGAALLFGRDERWWRFDGRALTPVTMPTGMPPPSTAEHGVSLPDGTLAFGTADGRVILVDAERRAFEALQVDEGFVAGLVASRFGGVLVVTDGGFHHLAWPSAWTALSAEHGLRGTLYGLARWDDHPYLLGTAGLLRSMRSPDGITRFEADPRLPDGVSDLLPLDADHALVAGSHHLFLLGPDAAERLDDEILYPRLFWTAEDRAGAVFVGTEMGLRRIERDAGQFRVGPAVPGDGDVLVLSLLQRPGELWLGTGRDGAWRIDLEANGQLGRATRFDEGQGLELGTVATACIDEASAGAPLVSTSKGFFRWAGERFERTMLDGLEQLREPDEHFCFWHAPDGARWALSLRRGFRQAAGGGAWREELPQRLRRGLLMEPSFDGDQVAVVASRSLLLFDGSVDEAPPAPLPPMRLRRAIFLGADGERRPLPLAAPSPLELERGDWGIRFEFAMSRLDGVASVRYRGRLLGYETDYGDWSRARAYSYWRLAPGSYTLELEGMDEEGHVLSAAPFRFAVIAPWYGQRWARVLAVLLTLLLLAAGVRTLLRRRTAHLAALIEDRTRALADANRRLEHIARRDGLTGVANRRALDECLQRSLGPQGNEHGSVALLAIDVDHFKQYNDSFGHQAGDRLLQQLVEVLAEALGEPDQFLARYGGEEFMVVLPGANVEQATAIAEALRSAVSDAALGATISIGVSATRRGEGSVDDLMRSADRALYAAKAAGRNRVRTDEARSADLER